MLDFLVNNIATVITLAVLTAAIAAIVVCMIRDKKKGRHISCAGDCKNCSACVYAGKDGPGKK